MPRPAWLIRSTRTRTVLSFQSRCRRTAKILVGGVFTSIGGQTRNHIARLDATTGLADSFNPNANGPVYSIAVQADGKILVGGNFTSIGGQTRNRIARLDAATGLADSFNPNANDCCPFNRGAGGRQDFGGRRFHHARAEWGSDGDAQPHRPSGNRRQARPDAQSQHRRQTAMFSPPPFSRTARFSSAAAFPAFRA